MRAAGPIALSAFRPKSKTKAEAWEKEDGSGLLTETDLAVNNALREALLGARPDYGWLSEEDADSSDRFSRERLFVVDPIDGTRSFAEGKPEFCLSVAIVENGAPAVAAIFAPALDALYDAVADGDARKNGSAIAASTRDDLDGARVLATKKNFAPNRWPGGAPTVSLTYIHPIAYRLCVVADGSWDAMVTLSGTNEWDVAAGDLIANRAGARTTEPSGSPIKYNTADARVAGVIAAPTAMHGSMVTRLKG